MTRLRTPSLKLRQNAEADDGSFKTPTTAARTTASRSQRKNTPLSTPVTSSKSRGRGRPKGSAVRKSTSRGVKSKSNPWDDDGNELHYGYQSHSDDDENDESYEDSLGTSKVPFESDFDTVDGEDEPQVPCNESKFDDAEAHIICPWIEVNEDELPALVLPDSSCDIPLLPEHVMEMIEIYEILRSYHRTLRLSPFSFEDFCSAMSSQENSCLLAEIHISLLKMCIRCDDEEQVHYSVIDTNNAFNIMIQSIDCMTYAEIIRQYLEADPSTERVPPEIMAAISTDNYPYVSINTRANVILYLCYRFLTSPDFRKIVNLGGKFQSEDVCRVCSKGGDMFPCSNCDAAFHSTCVDGADFDIKNLSVWICQLCRLNETKGVTDCIPLDQQSDRQPFRMEPLGYDRHGRIYWFVARRIIIQDQDETTLHYYSTAPQLYELVSRLDPHHLEYHLCKRLCERIQEILEQMALTLEMSDEHRDCLIQDCQVKKRPPPPKAYLHLDNVNRMSQIIRSLLAKDIKEEQDDSYIPLPVRMEPMLGIIDGHLTNLFWAGLKDEMYLAVHTPIAVDHTQLFIMGNFAHDEHFKKYRNHFTLHDFGDPPVIRKKLLDRKKYLSTKFSLQDDGDCAFLWSTARGRDMYGGERQHTKYVEWTLAKMAKKIPEEMMHRKWPEVSDTYKTSLANADSYLKLADSLMFLERNVRRTMFNSPFWGSLGHTKLTKTTVEDREQQSKEVQRRKKEEREISLAEEDDENFVKVKYTSLPSGSCPQGLWRQKDEIYRLGGKGNLGGWQWVSRTFVRKYGPVPQPPPIGLFDDEDKSTLIMSPSIKKAYRLHSLLEKLTLWRNQYELKQQRKCISDCYSPSCRLGLSPRYVCSSTNALVQSCYVSTCTSNSIITIDYDLCDPTMNVVKLKDPSRKVHKQKTPSDETDAWPLQKRHSFVSAQSGLRSILVIPKPILRKMSRQGGRKPIYVPNFSYTAKSNFSIWNYPCQRPCFDLCWRWLLTNARSLQAVALQLKILWYCIKWAEVEHTEDETNDGCVIVHLSDRDEVRRIIQHKELPPYGTYERYLIELEGVMLDDEPDSADGDWNDRKKNSRQSTRVKRPRGIQNKKTQKRQEWIDGVELRVFEIKKYWHDFAKMQREREEAAMPILSTSIMQTSMKYMNNENSTKPGAWNNRGQVARAPQGLRPPVRSPMPLLVTERRKPAILTTRPEQIYSDKGTPEVSQKRPFAGSYAHNPQDQYPPPKTVRITDNSPRYVTLESSTRRTSNGFEFMGGLIRGGGRVAVPVGDGMRRVITAPTQVAAEEVVSSASNHDGTNGDNDKPPMIPRYDQDHQERQQMTRPAQIRQVVPTQRSNVVNGPGKLLVIRRPDGTTQFLRPLTTGGDMQQVSANTGRAVAGAEFQNSTLSSSGSVPVRRIVSTVRGGRPSTVIRTDGSKVMRMATQGQGQKQYHHMQPNTRVVQSRGMMSAPIYDSQDDPFMRRMANPSSHAGNMNASSSRQVVQRMQIRDNTYTGDPAVEEYVQLGERGIRPPGRPPARVVQSYGYRVPMQRVVPRGGATMEMGQRISQDGFRSNALPPGVRRVTSYKEFCMKRGIVDNMRLPSRPHRFEFESNEDEERAIAEAIAREEEIMRQEEESKREQRGERIWNHPRIIDRYGQVGINPLLTQLSSKQPLTFNSNLMPTKDDTNDQKVMKQILDTLISQVCRWDKQFGWYKSILKRPRNRAELDRIKTRRLFSNQREVMLAEHVDRLRKEINKRRTKLENISEEECGLLTPWRKSRGRVQRAVRRPASPERQKTVKVVNPAEISLGGTEWMEDDQKADEKDELIEDTEQESKIDKKRMKLVTEQWKTHQANSNTSISTETQEGETMYGQALPEDFVECGMRYAVPEGMDPQALHCVCQQPYNPTKFYIACDLCSGWFHGECVEVTEESSRLLNGWLCLNCEDDQKNMSEMNQPGNQLYCICRRPYDDTLFYVGCDNCEGWFHPECVGITQSRAESMEQYVCPRCRQDDDYESNDDDDMQDIEENPLCRADYPLVWRLLDQLNESEQSWPFKQPHSSEEEDKEEENSRIDLPKIQGKLENLAYQRLSDFANDVNIMLENARMRYDQNSEEYNCTDELDKLFQQGLLDIQNEMEERRRQERRKASESRTIDSTLDIDTDQLIDINLDVDPSMYKQLL